MKKFDIPIYYRSPVISVVKDSRKITDPRKKDYTPSVLDFGPVKFLIARHFGFCYGVENAIEIAYRSLEQNPGKQVYLLSEMIHNPKVNEDLSSRGVKFIREHNGRQIIPWDDLKTDDIVIVPAFGTTLEIQQILSDRGIDPYKYDTTCPFVEKVWNRAEALGKKDYTIIVHGKYNHEETIATFSHSRQNSPTIIVRNIEETKLLCDIIFGKIPAGEFYTLFAGKHSEGFDVNKDLEKVGVVNQTTMLASETQSIADMLKATMEEKFGSAKIKDHYADTSDTLCYATSDNQQATIGLLNSNADFAIVVGGYNSSNTSHIVELCEEKLPVYFISGAEKIISDDVISHYNIHDNVETITDDWLKNGNDKPVEIILTSGASCPDAILDEVLQKIVSFFPGSGTIEDALLPFNIESLN
ncbi:MAG: 4-hydroxy-3-methylbut-2-enyl diphosphate reductase [Ignavibacteria bacterium]